MSSASKLKVALVVLSDKEHGGAYGAECGVIDALSSRVAHKFEYLIFAPERLVAETKRRFPNLDVCSYRFGLLTMFFMSIRSTLAGFRILNALGLRHGKFERSLIRNRVLFAYFLSPNPLALDLVDIPMMNTVWDLGHRDVPEFPEISGSRHFEEREFFFQRVLPKSVRVIVDTRSTAEKIHSLFGVDQKRITVGGLYPIDSLPNREDATDQTPYLLYPAQFWPHKRHVLLLEAFRRVLTNNPKVRLVLTGSDKGNLRHIIDVARDLGIQHAVEFRGFVKATELAALMSGAKCVVFPSQLGPSNLPPLEAAMLGTPSLISNVHDDPALNHPLIRIVEEQSPECWAMEINRLLTEPSVKVSSISTPQSQLDVVLEAAMEEFFEIRKEWSTESGRLFRRID